MYRNTDLGRKICGLLIDEDIVPCRYEGSGNYYEPDYLWFGALSISLAPNDKAVLYVDRDQSVFDGDKRRMVLYTFNRFEKPDFNVLKTLSRIEIEIDRKTEQAKSKSL